MSKPERMIRCIEGHVFDVEKHGKCPECGWAPSQSAKKEKRQKEKSASPSELLGSVFAALTAFVDRMLGKAGVKMQPHASAAIVYAAMILFCVGAVAYPGSPLWPGNWGISSGGKIEADKNASKGSETSGNESGPGKNAKKSGESSPFGPGNNSQGSGSPNPPAPISPEPIEVGGEGASGFGAIAFSPSKQYWGESYGFRSAQSAGQRALRECLSGAEGCLVGVSFYRQCGAISAAGNGAWGPGLGPTPQLAILDSMVACERNNGPDCKLQRVTCTR